MSKANKNISMPEPAILRGLISVIICTHNPRDDYFSRCLEGLKAQTLPHHSWELLIVDNMSSEPIEGRFDLQWHGRARIVVEEKLGLTPARLRGIRETRGRVLVFVDDDNVIDPDFLETTLRVAAEKPFLGSWSGQCRPSFEADPPEWTRRYWGNLVIREFEEDRWSNLPRLPETMPCGAGLCVIREVAERYLQINEAGGRRFQFDRTGDSLVSGGDNDLAACACDLGLGVGLVTALRLTHIIPPERLTLDYLSRLAEGIHFSGVILDAERGVTAAPRTLVGRLIDRGREMRLLQPHRSLLRAVHKGRSTAVDLLNSLSKDSQSQQVIK